MNMRRGCRARLPSNGQSVTGPAETDVTRAPSPTATVLRTLLNEAITTEITGEGESIAPLNDAILHADQEQYGHYHLKADWRIRGGSSGSASMTAKTIVTHTAPT